MTTIAGKGQSDLRTITLVGPASPRDLADLLSGGDVARAGEIEGYRGIPVSELARAFVQRDIAVEVVTTALEVDGATLLQGPRLQLLVAPMRTRPRDRALDLFRQERRLLIELLRTTSGSVVNAHWTYEFAWAALDGARPVLVTAQDAPLTILRHFKDPYRALRTLMAYLVRARIQHLAAVSPYLALCWRRQMLYRRPVAILPNVAPNLSNGAAPKKNRGSPARLVSVSNASRLKNVSALIAAFSLLRKRHVDTVLDLVGPGLGPNDPLAVSSRKQGLGRGVRFLGRLDRSELAKVLAAASVFVHPSLEDSLGVVLLEAMWAGLPVVAGERSGGVPWVLDYGRSGVLVDVRDPTKIAAAIDLLVQDQALQDELIDRARERVRAFSPEAVTAAYLDVLSTVRAAPE